jgi:hypothetical protein
VDGAPAHVSLAVGVRLGRQYPRSWFGCGPEASVSWPPRSPDLNPIDFNLWGSVKMRFIPTLLAAGSQFFPHLQCSNAPETRSDIVLSHLFMPTEGISSVCCNICNN